VKILGNMHVYYNLKVLQSFGALKQNTRLLREFWHLAHLHYAH